MEFVAQFGGRAYADVDGLMADPEVDLVVNLTTQHSHADVACRCLDAGKHVYSEKPLALSAREAADLVALADARGVRLSAAPSTFLAPPQQKAIEIVRSGALGTIRIVFCEVNWGRIETWHPAPESFYDVGPAVDVAVYPIALLTAALGLVVRVEASGRVALPTRRRLDGTPFTVGSSDFVVALLQLAGGAVVRLTASFYVGRLTSQRGIEFHGDDASLHLDTWFEGNGRLAIAEFGSPYEELEPPPGVFEGVDYGLGLEELAAALAEGRPQQASGAHGAHVAAVVEAITVASNAGRCVDVATPWAGHAQ